MAPTDYMEVVRIPAGTSRLIVYGVPFSSIIPSLIQFVESDTAVSHARPSFGTPGKRGNLTGIV